MPNINPAFGVGNNNLTVLKYYNVTRPFIILKAIIKLQKNTDLQESQKKTVKITFG